MLIGRMKDLSLIQFDTKDNVLHAFDVTRPFEVHALATYLDDVQMYFVKKNTGVLLPGANVSGWAMKQVEDGNLTFHSYTDHTILHYAVHEIHYMWLPKKIVELDKDKPNKELTNTLTKLEED